MLLRDATPASIASSSFRGEDRSPEGVTCSTSHRGGAAFEPGVDRAEVRTLLHCWGNMQRTLGALPAGGLGGLPESIARHAHREICPLITCKDHSDLAGLEAWCGI